MKRKLLILLILLVIFPPSAYSYYNYALGLANSSDGTAVDFVIESGQSVEEIAGTLERKGLIRSAALFRLYASLSKAASGLQAGEYQVPQNLNLKEVVELLRHGTFEEKLTFIEGWRREEYVSEISKIKNQSANGGSKLTANDFLRETEGLEGYLFPDTYFISTETTAEELVRMMRENFDKKVGQPELKDLTLDEVVTIASIVEREAGTVEDKPLVAGILIKRYLNDWALQADATIQYALGYQTDESASGGWWKKNLVLEDLEIESPFNTYEHPGLPPTPICNPGLDSLNATLNPTATDYWYYVSDSDGQMHFSVTNEEHNENVAKHVR